MSVRTIAVVVNFRTPESTVRAVRSLRASQVGPTEVVIVDNASGDDSLRHFEALAGVTVVTSPRNDGFSSGCNLGIKWALAHGAARVFLLNSDAEVAPDAIHRLGAALDIHTHLGIVGPAIVRRGGTGLIESLGISYNSATGRMWNLGSGSAVRPAVEIAAVAGVTGCAMLIRREVFEAVGVFSEEFFFGLEDLDLCLRARRAHWESACVPAALVLHEGGASIGAESPRRLYFGARNHLLLARRASPSSSGLATAGRTAFIVALSMAHAVRAPGGTLRSRLHAVARGTRDYFEGRFGPDRRGGR